ncbi:MAG TPA: metallopeptidase TldD-related protein, partial [Microlunatus sp.]|nr:metallopeptidase TldD-related protein [Microlunatus sp.]
GVGVITRQAGDDHDVAGQVAEAERAARASGPAEDAAEPVPPGGPDADFDAAPEPTDIDVFAAVAPALGAAFREAEQEQRLLFGFAEHIVTTSYLGASTGLRRRSVQRTGRFELNAKTADLTASAWVGAATADFSDVDVTALVAESTRRLGWHARTVDLPPGRYETILPPSAVADLMIYAYWTAGARAAEEGRSVFSAKDGGTRIGERLTELPVRLWSDPRHPGIECDPVAIRTSSGELGSVFDNGMPLRRTEWISDGRLNELIRTRAWAARTGAAPTAEIDNLIMDAGGSATLEEMIAGTERGLLLTCLWYIREVDPQTLLLTGLTRDGVYLIENGEITAAVNNFRFNESPIDLLSRITEVGRSEKTLCREWNDWFTRTVMPPVRVPDFNMSTVSQAR